MSSRQSRTIRVTMLILHDDGAKLGSMVAGMTMLGHGVFKVSTLPG